MKQKSTDWSSFIYKPWTSFGCKLNFFLLNFASIFLLVFSTLYTKAWECRFLLVFGVCNTQRQVKIYNMWPKSHCWVVKLAKIWHKKKSNTNNYGKVWYWWLLVSDWHTHHFITFTPSYQHKFLTISVTNFLWSTLYYITCHFLSILSFPSDVVYFLFLFYP